MQIGRNLVKDSLIQENDKQLCSDDPEKKNPILNPIDMIVDVEDPDSTVSEVESDTSSIVTPHNNHYSARLAFREIRNHGNLLCNLAVDHVVKEIRQDTPDNMYISNER